MIHKQLLVTDRWHPGWFLYLGPRAHVSVRYASDGSEPLWNNLHRTGEGLVVTVATRGIRKSFRATSSPRLSLKTDSVSTNDYV